MQPSNIFLDAQGNSFLGDFGAAVRMGEPLREWTPTFLPIDISQVELAHPSIDNIALVTTVLTALRLLPSVPTGLAHWGMGQPMSFTSKQLCSAVNQVQSQDLRGYLDSLRQQHGP